MSYEAQRAIYRQLKADQQVIDQAAAQLHHQAIVDAYAGAENKHVAFALASVLDELARHRRLDEPVRAQTLVASRDILGEALEDPSRRP